MAAAKGGLRPASGYTTERVFDEKGPIGKGLISNWSWIGVSFGSPAHAAEQINARTKTVIHRFVWGLIILRTSQLQVMAGFDAFDRSGVGVLALSIPMPAAIRRRRSRSRRNTFTSGDPASSAAFRLRSCIVHMRSRSILRSSVKITRRAPQVLAKRGRWCQEAT
jgi:hypothetical protein